MECRLARSKEPDLQFRLEGADGGRLNTSTEVSGHCRRRRERRNRWPLIKVGGGTLTLSGATPIPAARSMYLLLGDGTTNGTIVGNVVNNSIQHQCGVGHRRCSAAQFPVGRLEKIGGGTLTPSGNNTYSGGTTINGGTLRPGTGGSPAMGALTAMPRHTRSQRRQR
jgi:autotransporter-associated beta strand protein